MPLVSLLQSIGHKDFDWLPCEGFSRIAEEVFGRGIEVLHRTGPVHHDHGACSNNALTTTSVGFKLAKSVIKHRRRKNYSLRVTEPTIGPVTGLSLMILAMVASLRSAPLMPEPKCALT